MEQDSHASAPKRRAETRMSRYLLSLRAPLHSDERRVDPQPRRRRKSRPLRVLVHPGGCCRM